MIFMPVFSAGSGCLKVMIRLSVVGRGALALIILRVRDIKVIIAYSSVVHIRIIIVVLFGLGWNGAVGGV